MEYLNSGTKYDLIIVGAEDKAIISGEFWDVIHTRLVRDKVALITEIWYLDTEANGPINKILSGCVITSYSIHYTKLYEAIAVSILSVGGIVAEYILMVNFLGMRLNAIQVFAALTALQLAFLMPLPGGLGALEASRNNFV